MLRTPEPKEQARLLAQLLKAEGVNLGHQKALHVVAQLAGHRNWNVMQAALAAQPPAPAESLAKTPPSATLEALIEAATDVVAQADGAGCSDDLTVTSATAVERLETVLQALHRGEPVRPDPRTFTVHGFGIGDVQSLRPDLSDDEAMQVLQAAERNYDASVGLNWDVLDTRALLEFAPYGIAAIAKLSDGREMACTVNLAKGSVYVGLPEHVTSQPYSQRVRLHPPEHGCHSARITLGEGALAETFVIADRADEVHDGDSELLKELSDDIRDRESEGGPRRTPLA